MIESDTTHSANVPSVATESSEKVLVATGRRILYAAYGSNLHPARLIERAPSAIHVGNAAVDGLALRFHKRGADGSGKCSVVASPGQVHVAIYEMNLRDKRALDKTEGLGNGYDELRLDIAGYGVCCAYRAQSTHIDERLLPFDWYRSLVLLGCQFNRFPAAYVEQVRALPAAQDPDHQRRTSNNRLVSTMAGLASAQEDAADRPAP